MDVEYGLVYDTFVELLKPRYLYKATSGSHTGVPSGTSLEMLTNTVSFDSTDEPLALLGIV